MAGVEDICFRQDPVLLGLAGADQRPEDPQLTGVQQLVTPKRRTSFKNPEDGRREEVGQEDPEGHQEESLVRPASSSHL